MVGVIAEAQQPKKVLRIGWLSAGSSATTGNLEAFRKELIALGYVEGKNIEILYRYAEGKSERLPELGLGTGSTTGGNDCNDEYCGG